MGRRPPDREPPVRQSPGGDAALPSWPYLGGMGRLILGLVVAFIALMVVLTVIHVFFYAFFFAVLALVAFGVFKVGRWSGRRRGRQF